MYKSSITTFSDSAWHLWSTGKLLQTHRMKSNPIQRAIHRHREERSLGYFMHLLASVGGIHHSIGTNVFEHDPIHGHGLACFPTVCDLGETTANVEACLVFVRLVDLLSNRLSLLTYALPVCLQGRSRFHLERLICAWGITHRLLLLFGWALTLMLAIISHDGRPVVEELVFDGRHARYSAVTRLRFIAISTDKLRCQYSLVHRTFSRPHQWWILLLGGHDARPFGLILVNRAINRH